MARYKLSQTADDKISKIYKYSLLEFGEMQADAYYLGLHAVLELLGDNPSLGRASADLGQGMRRLVYRNHVIFYKSQPDGILVVDIYGVRQHFGPSDQNQSE